VKLKLIAIFAISFLLFQAHGHEGKITVRVVGEDGLPIAGAKVEAQFESVGAPGSGWGNTSLNNVTGITDTNGLCILTGKSDEPSVGVAAFKDGYYGASGYGVKFTGSILGRWQPLNPTVEVVLQKKGVQVPMYARKLWEGKMPAENKPCGFDLIAGDWVAPYGKGETSDFIFQLDHGSGRTITNRYGPTRLFDNRLTVKFSNEGDGIQSFTSNPHSELRSSRQAPLENYLTSLIKRDAREEITEPTPEEKQWNKNARDHSDFQNDANYYFRVRTKKDASGNTVGVLYGKIYGEFGGYIDMRKSMFRLSFTYYLNPVQNSRNMEFNSQSNLFKNLKPLEQVTAP